MEDFDNAGDLDLMICAWGAHDPLRYFMNLGDATFVERTREAGLIGETGGLNLVQADYNNDGWLDFYVGTGDPELATLVPNRMFRNDGAGHFQDVTTAGGFGHLQKGHGIAFGDLRGNGFQDVYASLGGAYEGDYYRNALFSNPGNTNDWIKLKLVGTRSNRASIGARITVHLHNASGTRTIRKDVNSGSTFGGNSLRQEIGLGPAAVVTDVEVYWPTSGLRQVWKRLEPRHSYILIEGEAEVRLQTQSPSVAR